MYHPFIHCVCDTQLGLSKFDISEIDNCLQTCPLTSWHEIHVTSHTNQITDPAVAEWTDRNLTLESDSSLLESKHAEQLEMQCFKLLRNSTCFFHSPELLACVSPCYNKVIMEDAFNAEATAATRIISFIKHTLRTDNTLYHHKAIVRS